MEDKTEDAKRDHARISEEKADAEHELVETTAAKASTLAKRCVMVGAYGYLNGSVRHGGHGRGLAAQRLRENFFERFE